MRDGTQQEDELLNGIQSPFSCQTFNGRGIFREAALKIHSPLVCYVVSRLRNSAARQSSVVGLIECDTHDCGIRSSTSNKNGMKIDSVHQLSTDLNWLRDCSL